MKNDDRAKLNLEDLKNLHNSGGILLCKPVSFDVVDIPDEIIKAWQEFLSAKYRYKEILEKYGINL